MNTGIYIQGKDIIAALLIIGCFVVKSLGYDSTLDYVIISIAVAYGLANYIPQAKK